MPSCSLFLWSSFGFSLILCLKPNTEKLWFQNLPLQNGWFHGCYIFCTKSCNIWLQKASPAASFCAWPIARGRFSFGSRWMTSPSLKQILYIIAHAIITWTPVFSETSRAFVNIIPQRTFIWPNACSTIIRAAFSALLKRLWDSFCGLRYGVTIVMGCKRQG